MRQELMLAQSRVTPLYRTLVAIAIFASQSAAEQVVAISGEPYGVGAVEIEWEGGVDASVSIDVSSADSDVLYPAAQPIAITVRDRMQLDPAPRELKIGRGRILERLGQVVKAAVTAEQHEETVGHVIWFLFRGDEPFELKVNGPETRSFIVQPASAPTVSREMFERWWAAYQESAEIRLANRELLPAADAYLLSRLSKQLDLSSPIGLSRMRLESAPSPLRMAFDSAPIERIALASMLERHGGDQGMLYEIPGQQEQDEITPLSDNEAPEGIEDIARFVPPECFYLRFGSFANLLWFQKLAQEHGGDVLRMVAMPSLDQQTGERVEELLNVKYTKLADLFGDQLIGDVALVGTDMLVGSGPSIGILLKAKNNFLLSTFLQTDRIATAAKFEDCSLDEIEMLGIRVSMLSTPDNRIRSFAIQNGKWFFITSSRHLAERFIQSRKEKRTLAATIEFQQFRKAYPLPGQDPITIFVSSRFLGGIMAPDFQLEAYRRSRSAAEIALLRVAALSAAGDGKKQFDIESLKSRRYLNPEFNQRVDNSRIEVSETSVLDSTRGARRTMLPILDADKAKASAEETMWLEKVFDGTRGSAQFAPLFIQIARESIEGRDSLTIQADLSPQLFGENAKWLRELGPSTDLGVQFPEDDLVSFHANVQSQMFGGSIPPHLLFGGIKDCKPVPIEKFQGQLDSLFAISSIRGYVGAWPDPGVVDRLPFGLGNGTPVGPNVSRLVGGAYRFQSERVNLLSFQSEVLDSAVPQLAILDKQPQARAAIKIKDCRGTQLAEWVNDTLTDEAAKRSKAAASLLNMLPQQLRVSPAEAKVLADDLLGANLICALGGEFVQDADGRWQSTADGQEDVVAPLLRWFGGTELSVHETAAGRLLLNVDLEIKRASSMKPSIGKTPSRLSSPANPERAEF